MKTSEAIDYYGNKVKLAAALGLELPSVYDWGDFPPPLRQMQLEKLSGGALKAEPFESFLAKRPAKGKRKARSA